MSSLIFTVPMLVLALLIGAIGLSFLSVPRGGENEVTRAIGAGIMFICIMGIVGLLLVQFRPFNEIRPATGSATASHR
jgi:hypothetical protein